MDLFQHFPHEPVTLIKKDGQRIPNIQAHVQARVIYTINPKLSIGDGDHFERQLPSGNVETYLVLDAGFIRGMHGIPDHYQSKVQKTTARRLAPTSVVYNVTGANSRVNVDSNDSSVNVVSVNSSELFNNMRQVAQQSGLDATVVARDIEHIDAMESTNATKTLAQRYVEFVAIAADHISLYTPFLHALAQLMK